MFLIIDTADSEKIFIALIKDNKILIKKELKARYRQAEILLPAINKLIKQYHHRAIKGIIIVSGPGSFTSLRIGIATANTLGWVLNIPVAGVKLNEFNNLMTLMKVAAEKLRRVKVGQIVEPFYGQEPNITLKK